MHIVLTDILTCPRCGPEYGLILLAERMQDRRVQAGALGCANCREKYAVRDGGIRFDDDGAADAAPDARAVPGTRSDSGASGADAAMRLAALLGITHGPAFMLVIGPAVAHAEALAGMIEDIEVIAAHVDGDTGPGSMARPGVNRMWIMRDAARLPLASGKVPAVALTGTATAGLLEEAVRVLSAVGRLVLDPAPADAEERLAAHRLRVLAKEGDTIVAARY